MKKKNKEINFIIELSSVLISVIIYLSYYILSGFQSFYVGAGLTAFWILIGFAVYFFVKKYYKNYNPEYNYQRTHEIKKQNIKNYLKNISNEILCTYMFITYIILPHGNDFTAGVVYGFYLMLILIVSYFHIKKNRIDFSKKSEYYEKMEENKKQKYHFFRDCVWNNEDQILIKEILENDIPWEMKTDITAKFNKMMSEKQENKK